MKLELVAHTPYVEELIATAMLTTTSKLEPSTIFHRLSKDPKRVARVLGRLEVQHGSILDHNGLCWMLEATEGEILDILLKNRFFSFACLGEEKWLLGSNLRTAIRYAQRHQDLFGEALVESLREVAPTIKSKMKGKTL